MITIFYKTGISDCNLYMLVFCEELFNTHTVKNSKQYCVTISSYFYSYSLSFICSFNVTCALGNMVSIIFWQNIQYSTVSASQMRYDSQSIPVFAVMLYKATVNTESVNTEQLLLGKYRARFLQTCNQHFYQWIDTYHCFICVSI